MECNFKTCLKKPKLTPCCLKMYRGRNKFILDQPKKTEKPPLKNLYLHINYLSGDGKNSTSDCYQKGYKLDRSNLQLDDMYDTYTNMINTIGLHHDLTKAKAYTLSYSLIFLTFNQDNNITNFSQLFLKYAIKNLTEYDGTTIINNNGSYEDILPRDDFKRLVTKLIKATDTKSQIFAYLDPRLELLSYTTTISATFETILYSITISNEDIFNDSYLSFDEPDIISSSEIFNNESSKSFSKLFTPNTSWGCVYKFYNLTAWSYSNYCSILINEEAFYTSGSDGDGKGRQVIRQNNKIIHEDNSKLSFLRNIKGEYDFMTVFKVEIVDSSEVLQTHGYYPCFIDTNSYVYLLNYPYEN